MLFNMRQLVSFAGVMKRLLHIYLLSNNNNIKQVPSYREILDKLINLFNLMTKLIFNSKNKLIFLINLVIL